MRIIKDDSVETYHGFYRCPKCDAEFYGGGPALHNAGCLEVDYSNCEMHVGPRHPQYAIAEDGPTPFMPTKPQWDKAKKAVRELNEIRAMLDLQSDVSLLDFIRGFVIAPDERKRHD